MAYLARERLQKTIFWAISLVVSEPLVLTNVINIAKIHCEGLGRFSLLSSALSQPFLFFAPPRELPLLVIVKPSDLVLGAYPNNF